MGLFDFYWILLVISGILMLGIGASGFGRATKGVRIVNVLFGAGFIGYGLYLGLFFTGGTYIIFFKAFIVPVLLVVNAIRSKSAQSKAPPPVSSRRRGRPPPASLRASRRARCRPRRGRFRTSQLRPSRAPAQQVRQPGAVHPAGVAHHADADQRRRTRALRSLRNYLVAHGGHLGSSQGDRRRVVLQPRTNPVRRTGGEGSGRSDVLRSTGQVSNVDSRAGHGDRGHPRPGSAGRHPGRRRRTARRTVPARAVRRARPRRGEGSTARHRVRHRRRGPPTRPAAPKLSGSTRGLPSSSSEIVPRAARTCSRASTCRGARSH